MFLSHEDLKLHYGVDLEISKFFVDRRVPANNLYWNKRLLYINPLPGYLFLPLYLDIEYRLGIDKATILSEPHIQFIEAILDSAARLEVMDITFEKHIEECIQLSETRCNNPSFFNDLKYYFKGQKEKASVALGTPFPALARADAFLFSLCYLNFDQPLKLRLVESWYALISFYLVLDDLQDIKKDLLNKEENSVLEAGCLENGAEKIELLLDNSYEIMQAINPVIANRIDFVRKTKNVQMIIDSITKEQIKA